ncbi:MAG: ribosome biogenesis GTP-binding protein YihA/YsxC [Thermodesulfobacteriota bacterium]
MSFNLILEYTCYTPGQLPLLQKPQIAFAGRSNVGKSSLINCLAGRKNLARTSSSPGKTRSINFYQAKAEELFLVDLPGYGFAKRSKQEREKWAALVQAYLDQAPGPQGMVLLLDSRIPPQELDLELMAYIQASGLNLQPVLTKIDKCKMSWKSKIQKQWAEILDQEAEIILFSAKTSQGADRLSTRIRELATAGPV